MVPGLEKLKTGKNLSSILWGGGGGGRGFGHVSFTFMNEGLRDTCKQINANSCTGQSIRNRGFVG